MTERGNRIPIDEKPVAGGNLVVSSRLGDLPHVRVLRKGEDPGDEPTYTSHFATCPNARRHRRAR